MPKFQVKTRETWETLVEYELEALSEADAKEEIAARTSDYIDFEHLDREVKKIIEIEVVPESQHGLSRTQPRPQS